MNLSVIMNVQKYKIKSAVGDFVGVGELGNFRGDNVASQVSVQLADDCAPTCLSLTQNFKFGFVILFFCTFVLTEVPMMTFKKNNLMTKVAAFVAHLPQLPDDQVATVGENARTPWELHSANLSSIAL